MLLHKIHLYKQKCYVGTVKNLNVHKKLSHDELGIPKTNGLKI